MKIIAYYSTFMPLLPDDRYYPPMWYARLKPDGTWFVGKCWWQCWRTYNPRGCNQQVYNQPQLLQYRTTLFGRKRMKKAAEGSV